MKRMLLHSKYVFDSVSDLPYEGYVITEGKKIISVERGRPDDNLKEKIDEVIELDNKMILPGFIDVHTFFTGYAIYHVGMDLAPYSNIVEAMSALQEYIEKHPKEEAILGHGWNKEHLDRKEMEKEIEKTYPCRPVILFSYDRSSCIMNEIARKTYGFCAEECYPEAYYKIMRQYLNDRSFIEPEFRNYMKMMNSRGVTCVKEMGFDDFYGFDSFLKEMEQSDELTLRTFFMSQPVGEGINIEYGKRMKEKFTGDMVRFSGYNRMTDGTVASTKGDLLKPYENMGDVTCTKEIPYDVIREELKAADDNGFRYSLHAQGDGAVHKVVEMYDRCRKKDGKLVNRHAITDMEFSNPADLQKFGAMGGVGEIYFQIMSLDPAEIVIADIERTIGKERGKYFWNRRGMIDSGMILSGATDLPLMITDIPEAIFHGCGGFFPDGECRYNTQNTIDISEMLKAWTKGGAYNIGMEDKLGTIEVGKLADMTVLDRNVFDVSMSEMRDVKVALTMVNGEIVFKK